MGFVMKPWGLKKVPNIIESGVAYLLHVLGYTFFDYFKNLYQNLPDLF